MASKSESAEPQQGTASTAEHFHMLERFADRLECELESCHRRNTGDSTHPLQAAMRRVINCMELTRENEVAMLYKLADLVLKTAREELPLVSMRVVRHLESDPEARRD